MENRDERHRIDTNLIRMNLHCVNRQCAAREEVSYTPHMGVLAPIDIWSGPWICYEYNFPFKIGPWWFFLTGIRNGSTVIYLSGAAPLYWKISSKFLPSVVPFIPISTGDDMHERAWDLINQKLNTKALQRLSIMV
jgi:hypothetical protein